MADDHLMCGNLPFGNPVSPDDDAVPRPRAVDQDLVDKERPAERAAIADVQWANGSTVTVGFIDGTDEWSDRVRGAVKDIAPEWSKYANLKFDFVRGFGDVSVTLVPRGDAPPGTYSSYLGVQSLDYSRARRPSMNLIFDPQRADRTELRRVILHEFGHAIGLIHEHHRPDREFVWNEAAVIAEYKRITRGQWSESMIRQQVMNPYPDRIKAMSEFDAKSIMIYPIARGLARYKDGGGDYVVGWNTDLSEVDKRFIAKLYPGQIILPPTPPPPPPTGTPGPAVREITSGTPVDDSLPAGGQRRYAFTNPAHGMVAVKVEGSGHRVLGELFGPDDPATAFTPLPQAGDNTGIDTARLLLPGKWWLQLRFDDPAAAGGFKVTVRAG